MSFFPNWYLNAVVLGITLPDLVKFAVFLACGIFLGKILRYPIAQWLGQASSGTDHVTGLQVGRSIERAVFLLVFAIVLKSGAIEVLHLPGWIWEKSQHLVTILMAIAATALALQVSEIILLGLRKHWRDAKSQVDDHLIRFIRKGIRIFVVLIAALVTADNVGLKVTGIIAGLGIGGAALALAAQGIIANLLGTIEVVADKVYRVGDRISCGTCDGFVTDIGLRSTRISALSGEQFLIPNKKMADAQIQNFSRNGLVYTKISLGIANSKERDSVGHAQQLLDEIFQPHQDVEHHQIGFKGIVNHMIALEIVFWARYSNSSGYVALISEIHLEIKRRLEKEKIEFTITS